MKISFIVVWERRKPPHVPTSFKVIAALGKFQNDFVCKVIFSGQTISEEIEEI